jgi:dienelactone hydrolase
MTYERTDELPERRRRDSIPLLSRAGKPGPHPAVLILQRRRGPEDGYTEIAERLAAGAISRSARLEDSRRRSAGRDRRSGPRRRARVSALASRRQIVQRLAVFGFCRGGVHALMAATAHAGPALAIIFHGFAFRPERARPGCSPTILRRRSQSRR